MPGREFCEWWLELDGGQIRLLIAELLASGRLDDDFIAGVLHDAVWRARAIAFWPQQSKAASRSRRCPGAER